MMLSAPTEATAPEEDASNGTSERIKEEEMQVDRVQEWWASGCGPALVAQSPVLASVDAALLAELVRAGGNYHNVLSADRLDELHRRFGGTTEPVLEPLRRALQTRGGARSQARVVGMLLFREARALFEHHRAHGGEAPLPNPAPQAAAAEEAASGSVQDIKLDEHWSPPRVYVCADTYPEGAQMAVRAAPSPRGGLLTKTPPGTEYLASGLVGEYLQVCFTVDGAPGCAYVLHRMGDLVLLVPQAPAPPATAVDEVWSPARRYVCAESYPEGAVMSVRAAPSREGQQLLTIGALKEYLVTGRAGDYLQIAVEVDGSPMPGYIPRVHGDRVLLVPAAAEPPPPLPPPPSEQSAAPAAAAAVALSAAQDAVTVAVAAETATKGRVEALEAKEGMQDQRIQALEKEIVQLRTQLATIAAAFKPLIGGA